jgi:predicted transcriptional regulator
LFLYECETREVGQLREIAEPLGLSVQAASHTYRSLARRGLAELRDGRYRPTVQGVDWLHSAFGEIRDDLAERLDRLHIVRTTRAVAAAPIARGDAVMLSIEDGTLTAQPGRGRGSRGKAHSSAPAGGLVEVGDLEGIVPLPHGRLTVLAVPSDRIHDPTLVADARRSLAGAPPGLLLAFGLEASHLLGRAAPQRAFVRYGVAPAVQEATRLGVDCTLVAVDRQLPRLFEQMQGPDVPAIDFLPLGGRHLRTGRRHR